MTRYDLRISPLYEKIKNTPILTREEHIQHFKQFEETKQKIITAIKGYSKLKNNLNGTLNNLLCPDSQAIDYALLNNFLKEFYNLCNNKEKTKEYGLNQYKLTKVKSQVKRLHKKALEKRNFLIEKNLRLAVKFAVPELYRSPHMDFSDLIEEAIIGLTRGVEKFDYTKGFTFATYASWWMIQQMKRVSNENKGLIIFPNYLHEDLSKLYKFYEKGDLRKLKESEINKIIKKTGICPEAMNIFLTNLDSFDRVMSLNEKVASDTETEYTEKVIDTQPLASDILAETEVKKDLTDLLAGLSPKEEEIIRKRFGIDQNHDNTLQAVADDFGVTRERIRQMEVKILKGLKNKIKHDKKYKYLSKYFN